MTDAGRISTKLSVPMSHDNEVPSHVLTVRAPDHPGIVAHFAEAIAQCGGNIVELDQHSDTESADFGCRIEIAPGFDGPRLEAQLEALAAELEAQVDFRVLGAPADRIVVLCSKTLHCPSDLLARASIGQLSGDVVAVVSDQEHARSLAERYDVPYHYLPVGEDRDAQERALADTLEALDPTVVVLARYMRVLPEWLTQRYAQRMINIHHSFLPAFIGANPYARAHDRGVKLIGATAHYVTGELDAGPIIAQGVAPVSHRDDVRDLVHLGADVERSVLNTALRLHLERRVMVFGQRTCIFN